MWPRTSIRSAMLAPMTSRTGVLLGWMLIALLGSACVKPSTKQCGDFTCSQLSVCAPDGLSCVMPSQIEACQNQVEGAGCSYPGTPQGVCRAQLCIGAGCGNGVPEPEIGELCDDGNHNSNDGCNFDCTSREVCGDGVADFAKGEHCDCGTDPAHLPFGCLMIN